MDTINNQIVKIKSGAFCFIMTALLLACTPEGAQTESEPESPGTTARNSHVTLTDEQFRSSGMQLGLIQEYSFGETIKINGTIDVPPEGRADISSYYGGYVRQLSLLTGQKVNKGELLFMLENPEYIQMQQDFLEAKSQLTYLRSDFERQQTLSMENIASQKNFLRAESEYHITLAQFEGLKKKLALLNIKPEAITPENMSPSISIYAPISGYITDINAVNGAFLSPSDVAISIINTEHLHLDLNVFEKNISSIKKGQSISFRFPDSGDVSYHAEVFMVGRSIEADSRMINVHAHFIDENHNEQFTPGMYVEAAIHSTNETSKALPDEAVIEVAGKYFVLVKVDDRSGEIIFERKEVLPGTTVEGLTEILNGENFGEADEFLVKGAFNLIN